MGHLLQTTNPEAAAAIQPSPQARRLPGVGEMVIYHMRHGHARQGRTRFPAVVQGSQNERGTSLSLTVILEAGELRNETLVEEIGAGGDNGHVWERPDITALAEVFRGTITSLHQRIGEVEGVVTALERENKALRSSLLGDFNMPGLSLIDIMARLEKRVIAVEQAKAAKGKGK